MDGEEAAVELSADRFSFSDLIGQVVRDQSGRTLGRVYEVRGHWEHGASIVLDELMVGRRALLRRMRGPGPEAGGIPWQAVNEVSGDGIVVTR
jgi:sporulation protein YlmC with PRC-barrel domain